MSPRVGCWWKAPGLVEGCSSSRRAARKRGLGLAGLRRSDLPSGGGVDRRQRVPGTCLERGYAPNDGAPSIWSGPGRDESSGARPARHLLEGCEDGSSRMCPRVVEKKVAEVVGRCLAVDEPGRESARGDRRLAKVKAGAKSIVIVGLASPRGVFEPGVKAPRGPRRWKASRERESRRHITGVAVEPILGRASRQGSQGPDHWSGDETSEARPSGRRAEENAALRVGERINTARRKINPDGPPKRVGQP